MTPQDERVARGMATQLSDRAERGERHLGWKVGFGTAQAMVKLGTSAPLVGHLVAAARLDSGAMVPIGDWGSPKLEPEVAVHLASDVDASGGRDAVVAALGGLGAAIELVDLDPDADDPEDILARNIFQRAVLLGPAQDVRETHDLRLRVLVDGEEAVDTSDITAATGDVFDAVASVAQTLADAGEQLRAGDVVIAGSIVPALELEPGQEVVVELEPLGRLEVSFSA
jgi:2-oxo-3-hexenedioate decarboxylase